jgi:hypothetical protein
LSICNPISQAYAAISQSLFSTQCKERASLLVDDSNRPSATSSQQLGERHADFGIEGFHLPDNLMIVGAVHSGGYPK